MSTAGDDMLRWVSEVGSGRWMQLRDVSAYLNRRDDLQKRVSELPTQLEMLGHLNVDWDHDRWSVASPALNISPGMGLCAYLSGSRPKYVLDHWNAALDDSSIFPFEVQQGEAPIAMYVKCSGAGHAEAIADRLGIQLNVDPASALLSHCADLDDELSSLGSAPRTDTDSLEKWDCKTFRWCPIAGIDATGLYRIEVHGRFLFRFRDDVDWLAVDLAAGQFAELKRNGRDVLRWSSSAGGSLYVPRGVALPKHAQLAAVASSGMLPAITRDHRIYCNVSSRTALAIGEKLHQRLLQVKD